MATRWARVMRGSVTAVLSVFVAAMSHVAGGGSNPGVVGVVLALVFGGMTSIALAGKTLSRVRLAVSVAASQLAFHLLFVLGAGSSGTESMSMDASHQHGAMLLEVSAAPATSVMPMHNDPSMWIAHAFAAVITIVLLRRGEAAFWGLVGLARSALTTVSISRFVSIVSLPVDAVSVRVALADKSGLPDLEVVLTAQPRRGPPTPVLFAF